MSFICIEHLPEQPMGHDRIETEKGHAGSGSDKPVRPGFVDGIVEAIKETLQNQPAPPNIAGKV